jgi:hypothetical protein
MLPKICFYIKITSHFGNVFCLDFWVERIESGSYTLFGRVPGCESSSTQGPKRRGISSYPLDLEIKIELT